MGKRMRTLLVIAMSALALSVSGVAATSSSGAVKATAPSTKFTFPDAWLPKVLATERYIQRQLGSTATMSCYRLEANLVRCDRVSTTLDGSTLTVPYHAWARFDYCTLKSPWISPTGVVPKPLSGQRYWVYRCVDPRQFRVPSWVSERIEATFDDVECFRDGRALSCTFPYQVGDGAPLPTVEEIRVTRPKKCALAVAIYQSEWVGPLVRRTGAGDEDIKPLRFRALC